LRSDPKTKNEKQVLLAANGTCCHKLKLDLHQYNTNPNLFLEFFYLLRFTRSDAHKFASQVYEKKFKKRAPKN
jgi:hypothetical protein